MKTGNKGDANEWLKADMGMVPSMQPKSSDAHHISLVNSLASAEIEAIEEFGAVYLELFI
jgi:hypothetical protein